MNQMFHGIETFFSAIQYLCWTQMMVNQVLNLFDSVNSFIIMILLLSFKLDTLATYARDLASTRFQV